MEYLSNAFSLQMVPDGGQLIIKKLTPVQAKNTLGVTFTNTGYSIGKDKQRRIHDKEYLPAKSIIGHNDVCNIINTCLGLHGDLKYKPNRASIKLNVEDTLYVAQYIGERLPQGATQLPPGARVEFYSIKFATHSMVEKNAKKCERAKNMVNKFYTAAIAVANGHDANALSNTAYELFPNVFDVE